MRTFQHKEAVRGSVPLLIGLVGPSGGGKSLSALRLATGMQRITGGEIFALDTESRRLLHYADKYKFNHVEFNPPFGSLDYLAGIQHCVDNKAGIIIVDSFSHQHESTGGLLEQHEAERQRLSGGDAAKSERVNFLAWAKPKSDQRKLINSILQMNANFIFTFRAKNKLKMSKVKGELPEDLGFQPIASPEFVYELTVCCLLLPNANGVPTWNPDNKGENLMVKKPQQFSDIFKESKPIDESMGEQMAKWAAGDSKLTSIAAAAKALDDEEKGFVLDIIKSEMIRRWPSQSANDKKAKSEAIKTYFGVLTWDAVKSMDVPMLNACFKKMTDSIPPQEAA